MSRRSLAAASRIGGDRSRRCAAAAVSASCRSCGRPTRSTRSTSARRCRIRAARTGSAPIQLGRDVLSLLMKGMLTSFVVPAVARRHRRADRHAARALPRRSGAAPAECWLLGVGDCFSLFPALIVAVLLATLRAGAAIGDGRDRARRHRRPSRVRRATAVRQLRRLDYVEAAGSPASRGIGASRRHVLPAALGLLAGAGDRAARRSAMLAEAASAISGSAAQPPATASG